MIPANKKTSIQITLSVESNALCLNRCMIKKISRPIESMLIPNPRIKIGAKALNTSWGVGSYLSHSKKVGNILKTINKRTRSRIIGKKLSMPINSFELRDIKTISVKLVLFLSAC
jgi:hypothetical protein